MTLQSLPLVRMQKGRFRARERQPVAAPLSRAYLRVEKIDGQVSAVDHRESIGFDVPLE
jgi:hypothetical protein